MIQTSQPRTPNNYILVIFSHFQNFTNNQKKWKYQLIGMDLKDKSTEHRIEIFYPRIFQNLLFSFVFSPLDIPVNISKKNCILGFGIDPKKNALSISELT